MTPSVLKDHVFQYSRNLSGKCPMWHKNGLSRQDRLSLVTSSKTLNIGPFYQ